MDFATDAALPARGTKRKAETVTDSDILENHHTDPDITEGNSQDELASTLAPTTLSLASLQPSAPQPSDIKNHFCPYRGCKKVYNRRSKLNDHIRSHTNERPFICPHPSCTKDFRRDSHLKHHIKSAHSGVRDNVCNYEGCGKSFATGQRLRRHLAAHKTNERYKCKVANCGQLYRKHSTLQEHITKDHESGPYICNRVGPDGVPCGEKFDTATKLRTHEKLHGDLIYHDCKEPGCGQTFDKEGKYRLHQSTAHGDTMLWQCGRSSLEKIRPDYLQNWTGQDTCGKGFKAKGAFEEHILTFHLNQRHPRVDPNKKPRKRKKGASNLNRLTGTNSEEESGHPEATRPFDAEVGMTTGEQRAVGFGYENPEGEGVLEAGAATGGPFWTEGDGGEDSEADWDGFLRRMNGGVRGARKEVATAGGEPWDLEADWRKVCGVDDNAWQIDEEANDHEGYGHHGKGGEDSEDPPIDPALL